MHLSALLAPGAIVSVIVLAGIATGVAAPLAPGTSGAVALALLSLAVLEQPARWRLGLLTAALLAASAMYGAIARDRALVPPLVRWFDVTALDGRLDEPVLVRGTLMSDAVVVDGGVRLLIDVDCVHSMVAQAFRRADCGRVQAHVAGANAPSRVSSWTRGRVIEAPIVLRRPQVSLNPGLPGVRWQRLRQNFDLAGSIKSASLVSIAPGAWWEELAARVRQHVRNVNARYLLPRGGYGAAMAAAILIGDRAGLGDDIERRLQAAGTYHVIAISGGNVALIATLCFGVVRLLIRSPRIAVLVCIGAIVAYGLIVGGEASVSRAVVAACVYLSVNVFGLRPGAVNVLALVALCLAVIDPLIVIDVGAWLSFGATLGIVLFAGRLMARVTIEFRPRVLGAIVRAAAAILAATAAAELLLLPIAAAVFSRVSLAGLVCNLVAIPAMAIVQIAGLAMVLLDAWPAGAAIAAALSDLGSRLLIGSADLVTLAPWLSWRVPPPNPAVLVIFYASFGVASGMPEVPRRWRRVSIVAAAVSSLIVLTAPNLERAQPASGVMRVTMIDVGQGDAILVQTPGDHALLVDSGGTSGAFDIGGRIVTPVLWASGVRRLDWLVVTHPDLDHIGGALAVADDVRPREIWEAVPVPPNRERAALLAAARDRSIVWRQLLAGHVFEVGGVVFDVRHPPAPEWERQRTRNDDSLVLRARYGDVEVLLTGDAGVEYEGRELPSLEAEEGRAPLRVLKVGHHGSLSSSALPFVRAFAPQIALVSAGRGNLFGHPAPEIVARLEDAGAEIFRTDRDGAIILETDGRSISVRTMTGRHWMLETTR